MNSERAAAAVRLGGFLMLGLAVAAGAGAKGKQLPAQRPDIVVLMVDDLDMSVWQQALALGYLPRIQSEMIDKGTTFTQDFVALSTCCPSRSTYLTGQYPHNHHVLRNDGPYGGIDHFDNDASTLAVWLHDAGYRTGLAGKYLNGYAKSPKNKDGRYIPPGWDDWHGLFSVAQYDYLLSANGTVLNYGHSIADYQTDVLAGFAASFIRGADARPFFLTLTPTAPHYESGASGTEDSGRSIRPPDRYADTPKISAMPSESQPSYNEADMSDKPSWMRGLPIVDAAIMRSGYNNRLAAMRAVDDLLGTVIDALREVGRESSTLIVFTSDNGYQYGTHRRTAKTDLYEESIRLPLVVRAPGQTAPRQVDDWVMNTDTAPTLVDYAGAASDRAMDGRSLRPWIAGMPPPAARRSVLVELPSDGTPQADTQVFAMLRSKDPALTGDSSGLTTLVYAETYDQKGRKITDKELYDLSSDPLQLSSQHASKVPLRKQQLKAMAERLGQIKTCASDSCRQLEN